MYVKRSQPFPVRRFLHLKVTLERQLRARRADQHIVHAGLASPRVAALVVEAGSVLARHEDLGGRALAGLQEDFGEAFQLFHRARDAGRARRDVGLQDFGAGEGAGIGDLEGEGDVGGCW